VTWRLDKIKALLSHFVPREIARHIALFTVPRPPATFVIEFAFESDFSHCSTAHTLYAAC
tara:strand:- start:468 stop:647 length:180 start_codon:yes stop_codon:yes gene_type:complete